MLKLALKMIHDACGVIILYSPKSQKSASVRAATALTHSTISRPIHPTPIISVPSSWVVRMQDTATSEEMPGLETATAGDATASPQLQRVTLVPVYQALTVLHLKP